MANPAEPMSDELRGLLEKMVAAEASDLVLVVGERPRVRVHGELGFLEAERQLGPEDTERFLRQLASADQCQRFADELELDFSVGYPELCRFRINAYRQRGSLSIALRRIPYEIRSLEQLGIPPSVSQMVDRHHGLILVTGPADVGKTTTLAAIVDRINRSRPAHIITVEDPIEFVFEHDKALVSQREVGADTRSFSEALRHVMRQTPDVVMIGEMRDSETVAAALSIAETGHLVLASLHCNSAPEAIERIVDTFPSHRHGQVREFLAFVLIGIVSQVLVPRKKGKGLVAACEVLVNTPAVRTAIREDKVHQIASQIQAGRKFGMQSMNQALASLYEAGEVTLIDCRHRSPDPEGLRSMIEDQRQAG